MGWHIQTNENEIQDGESIIIKIINDSEEFNIKKYKAEDYEPDQGNSKGVIKIYVHNIEASKGSCSREVSVTDLVKNESNGYLIDIILYKYKLIGQDPELKRRQTTGQVNHPDIKSLPKG
jgi:hypothetical protein